jgi:hypothetical protein
VHIFARVVIITNFYHREAPPPSSSNRNSSSSRLQLLTKELLMSEKHFQIMQLKPREGIYGALKWKSQLKPSAVGGQQSSGLRLRLLL